MTEQAKATKINPFWTLPPEQTKQLVEQARAKAAAERKLAREAESSAGQTSTTTTASKPPPAAQQKIPAPPKARRNVKIAVAHPPSNAPQLLPLATDAEAHEAGNAIADRLGESLRDPRALVIRVTGWFGVEQAEAWCRQALEIHAGEGMMTKTKGRKRTKGGIFFVLVRQSPDYWRRRMAMPYAIDIKRARRSSSPQ